MRECVNRESQFSICTSLSLCRDGQMRTLSWECQLNLTFIYKILTHNNVQGLKIQATVQVTLFRFVICDQKNECKHICASDNDPYLCTCHEEYMLNSDQKHVYIRINFI